MIDCQPIAPFLASSHRQLAPEIDRFAGSEIAPLPHPQDDDAGRAQGREILRRLGAGGWSAWTVPAAWGGRADSFDLRACCLIREALGAASSLADSIFALQGLGSLPITLAGADAVQRRWLPAVAAGEAMAGFALTEPEAGSDPAGMATRAVREGDGWRLDGHKVYISNAGLADFYTLFASTDPAAGHRGISAFVLPADTPGLTFRAQRLSAPHPLGELFLDGCRLPADSLLGEVGGGFKLALKTLDRLRPTVAAAACGMARRALDEALAHATSRQQFGQPLASFQLTQQKIARMATDLTAARLLTYRAAAKADDGAERITLEAAMAKSFATEAAQRIVDDAVQILGGRGVVDDHPVDLLYRAVRALRIYEGTTEIQHLVIAKHVLAAFGDAE
ncbi:MAG: acyl-CoA dehydrogenase family protein [Acidobacteriota bacterium]